MEQEKGPFPNRGGTNPNNQFFSVFEREENNLRRNRNRNNNNNNPYNLDESVGQILNKTFGNSIESSYYYWDHDDSNLLGDLDDIKQEQAAQRRALQSEQPQFDPNFLKELMMQQQKRVSTIKKQSSPQRAAAQPQATKKKESHQISDQVLGLRQQTSQKKQNQLSGQGQMNMLFGREDKLGETVISEYVSEDFHSQHASPIKEGFNQINFNLGNANGNNQSTAQYILGNQNQLSVLVSQLEDNAQSTSQVQNEISVLSILKEQELEKPIYINVMVAGAQGLGKSTFIDAFLNKKFQTEQTDVIRPKTQQIVEIKGVRKENKINLNLNMIDTPGYTEQSNLNEWTDMIIQFVTSKFEQYQVHEDMLINNRNSVQQEDDKDCRVHVLLYFMQGPRISKSDIQAMLTLSEYLNIIPILAKGDCYTTDEVKQIKANIMQDAHDNKIPLFDCEAPLKNDKDRLAKLKNGPFGMAPPFLMISSVQKIEVEKKFQYARKYPWGICKIEDPEHSDFLLLYQLLIGFFINDLKKLTEVIYKSYLKKMKKQAKLEKKKKKITQQQLIGGGVSVVAAIGFGLFKFFQNK